MHQRSVGGQIRPSRDGSARCNVTFSRHSNFYFRNSWRIKSRRSRALRFAPQANMAAPIELSAGMKRSLPTDGDDMLEIMPLGAGSEVGRSCVLAKYKGKSVMFDCGVHPGYAGIASLPYFDEVDLSTVDVLLVTHFHLDHCAAVPFLVGHTNFRGRILMTHPTKAIFSMLMTDFVKLNKQSDSEALFTDKDVKTCMERIEVIDFHQEVRVGYRKPARPRPTNRLFLFSRYFH